MLIPINGRILVEPTSLDKDRKTPGGIIIPEGMGKEKAFYEGVVRTMASDLQSELDKKEWASRLSEGDTIIYSKYAGIDITKDNEDRVLLKYDDILGITAKAKILEQAEVTNGEA